MFSMPAESTEGITQPEQLLQILKQNHDLLEATREATRQESHEVRIAKLSTFFVV